MHGVDQTTEQMVRSVLAYAENRLPMIPVPLDALSSIVNTLGPLEMDALVVETPDHRLNARAVLAAIDDNPDLSDVAALRETAHLEMIREPDLGVVLFRRLDWNAEDYDRWAAKLHDEGVPFVPPSKWDDETVGRLVFLHPDTSMDLVREILARTT